LRDTLLIKAYSDLCWEYRNISPEKAIQYGNNALSAAQKVKNKKPICDRK
jgi:hypothetical protein